MKNLAVLGSTGSIGRNTLKIAEMFPERFSIKALTCAENIEVLASQIEVFHPEAVAVLNEDYAAKLKDLLPEGTIVQIFWGNDGYCKAACLESVNMVVAAMVGSAGLMPALCAISSGKDIALANKENLVMAGEIVMKAAYEKNVNIVPVDSEHSAIFQCLSGNLRADFVEKIYLTASGGPFLNTPKKYFSSIRPEDALKHPNWQMGKKITIDSATMMNKGLEVIEAASLFNMPLEKIEVIVHPQSIVHSMIGYIDGSIVAQLGIPDMKAAIAYALSYPERLDIKQPFPDFINIKDLTFIKPDMEKFPCLSLAIEACEIGKTMPAVLNASNETAVWAFLDKKISFVDIPILIENVMKMHKIISEPCLSDIIEADSLAREISHDFILRS